MLNNNKTDLPLNLPEGFEIFYFAKNLSGARVVSSKDELGNRWLSRTSEGVVSLLEIGEDGKVKNQSDVFTGLNRPHGLAFDPQDRLVLYIAETDKISKVRLYTEGEMEEIADLPAGGRHFTRSLLFGSDDKLYVSIGSSCDTCVENDARRASIYRMNKDGSDFEKVAEGLRNAVFMTNNPIDGSIWATEMGRDNLGDDLPPDEINIIKQGQDYGWPFCYGKNVKDETFDSGSGNSCINKAGSHIDLQAHSAPLGLDFIPEEGWPSEYGLDLMVAYHGSWNRTISTGYKVVRMKLDDQGNLIEKEDFISGWLTTENEKLGRPVDIVCESGGIMFITDDLNGVVYQVKRIDP